MSDIQSLSLPKESMTGAIRNQHSSVVIPSTRAGSVTTPSWQLQHGAPQIPPREPIAHFPITRLPPETLCRIFEFCVDHRDWLTHIHCFPIERPFLLAQVCRLWRVIVESDPYLWTTISFHFSDDSSEEDLGEDREEDREEDVPRVRFIFDLYLQRSGALPISFTLIDHRFYHEGTEDLISLLVDRLRTHSHRWKYILLQLPSDYFHKLFAFTPCDLFSLEHLRICGDVSEDELTPPHLNLESAINLKSFSYTGPGGSSIGVQWDRLTSVAFDFVPYFGVISTLARRFTYLAKCQNLTTCSLGIDPALSDLSDNQTITLPCLQTLRVRRLSPWSHARSVIDPLVLPQLQTLEIDTADFENLDDESIPWLGRNFSNLLTRSGCFLRHLSIEDVDFPNQELLRCLTLSPTLQSFHFIPYPRSRDLADIIRRLDVFRTRGQNRAPGRGNDGQKHAKKGPLVPALRNITLGTSEEAHMDPMLAMLRSRAGSRARAARVAALRRVEVLFFDIPSAATGDSGTRSWKFSRFERELVPWLFESGDWEKGETHDESLRSLRVRVVPSS